MHHITILTLFPDMFRGPFDQSIIHRACKKGIVDITYLDIRTFSTDAYKSVDDHPYGGGHGMIFKVDVIDRAIIHAKSLYPNDTTKTILLDPQGKTLTQQIVRELSKETHLILLCGHYEGIDERIRSLVDVELSIGDYILTGGEIPAMVLVDSVVRLLPGVLSKQEATAYESFEEGKNILEYPQYTRPEVYKRKKVPSVLTSGDHAAIEKWRNDQALSRTKKRRPDLVG